MQSFNTYRPRHMDTDRLQQAQYGVTEVLTRAKSPDAALIKTLEAICQNTGWTHGAFWSVDASSHRLSCSYQWNHPDKNNPEFEEATKNTTFAPGEGLIGAVWEQGESIWLPDVTEYVGFLRLKAVKSSSLKGALALPIVGSQGTLGVMEFFHYDVSKPTERLFQQLTSIGNQIGMFIERLQAEQEQRKLAEIVESSDDAIIGYELDGTICSWNNGAQRLYGYEPAEIINQSITTLLLRDHYDRPRKLLSRIKRGRRVEPFETQHQRKDGSLIDVSLTVSPVKDGDDTVIGAALIARDITEQKKLEVEKFRRAQQREDFVATLTHDLKTPILAANRAVRLLLDGDFGELAPAQCEMLDNILENNREMYSLVQTLLNVYHYDSGEKRLNLAKHDLVELTESVIAEFFPLAQSKKIEIRTDLPDNSEKVVCDSAEIKRVLQNLLDNALKFTECEGRIEVLIRQANNVTRMSITDTGQGIADEDKPKLFERFWQAASHGRYYAGTGLGLYLCHKVIELHNGKIWCDSEVGKGSTFTFTIESLHQNA
jgi:two-component system, sensor histidine kinase and response regulator